MLRPCNVSLLPLVLFRRQTSSPGQNQRQQRKAESASPGPQHIAGEASGSGLMKPESMAADLAASFEPAGAAGAINAVIVPPCSSSRPPVAA